MTTHPRASEETLAAVHAMFQALDGSPEARFGVDFDSMEALHPIFSMAEAFLPNDPGYTGGPAVRGGHLSVPFYDEFGEVGVIETTFHKGTTTVVVLDFPQEPESVHQALEQLLRGAEIRD